MPTRYGRDGDFTGSSVLSEESGTFRDPSPFAGVYMLGAAESAAPVPSPESPSRR